MDVVNTEVGSLKNHSGGAHELHGGEDCVGLDLGGVEEALNVVGVLHRVGHGWGPHDIVVSTKVRTLKKNNSGGALELLHHVPRDLVTEEDDIGHDVGLAYRGGTVARGHASQLGNSTLIVGAFVLGLGELRKP
jgi:hypothetical protein